MENRRISKILSLVLRHKPEVLGIILDENGWVSVETLIEALASKRGIYIDLMVLNDVVENNDKKRFSFNHDKDKIRANQGHSIKVDLELNEVVPPEFLYHGTVEKFLDSIKEKGLLKMDRNHVHLSDNINTASSVGKRRGSPIILRIDSGDMHKDGHKFYISENGVWLTEKVGTEYIQF